jgi:predicted permease
MKLYRWLLRLYPREFREVHGAEMERTFARLLELEGRRSRWAGRWAWVAGCLDVLFAGLSSRLRGGVRADAAANGRRKGWRIAMNSASVDVRYGVRLLLRQPVFALTAVVTLALGIGANGAIFSVVYALLFRPMPYPDADRLVLVWSENPGRGWTRTDVSVADAWDWKTRTNVFEDLAVIGRASPTLTGVEQPERLEARTVTPNVFEVFGVTPALGRGFEARDGEPNAARVVILSNGYWQRRFGSDRDVIGREVTLDGEPVTIVGVLPATFVFPDAQPDAFIPMRVDPLTAPRTNHSHNAIARLRPGVTVEQARREVAAVTTLLEREHPETNRGWESNVVTIRSDLVGDVGQRATLVLMGAVGFVLLMACVNVANLLLARASGRRREMAVRNALGAGRARLVRQLLSESLVLGVGGGALGVLLSIAAVPAITAAMPPEVLAGVFRINVDGAVLLFALCLALAATLGFGLVPALRASSPAAGDLRDGDRAGIARATRRFGGTLVVVQTALAVILLVGGGVMMRSVIGMQRQDLGYEIESVLTLRLTPPASRYAEAEDVSRFYDAVLERVRALPGVEAAGTIQSPPLAGSNSVDSYVVVGQEAAAPEGGFPARFSYVSPGYFETMGATPVRGRSIQGSDRAAAPRIALVNETLSRLAFGEGEPIGRALRFDDQEWTIVGVAPDMRERALMREPEPSIYVPVAQEPVRSRTLMLRTSTDPAAHAAAVQAEVWAVDPNQPVYGIQTMRDLLGSRLGPFELVAGLMVCFALISLVLAAVGIYGVTACGVGRRKHEIGIRIAMGAERRSVVGMIVRESMRRALIGLTIGVVAALGLSQAMRGILVGVSPTDPLTFGLVVAVLMAVALAGAYLPARRAARLDPVRALGAGG